METAKAGFVSKSEAARGIVVMGSGHLKDNLLDRAVFGVFREIPIEVLPPEIYSHIDVTHLAILLTPVKSKTGVKAVILLVTVEVNKACAMDIVDKGCDIKRSVTTSDLEEGRIVLA